MSFRAQLLLRMQCIVGGRSLAGILKAGETLRNVLPIRFIGCAINIFTITFISTFPHFFHHLTDLCLVGRIPFKEDRSKCKTCYELLSLRWAYCWPSASSFSLLRESGTLSNRQQGGQPHQEELGFLCFPSSHSNLDLTSVSFIVGRRVILSS